MMLVHLERVQESRSPIPPHAYVLTMPCGALAVRELASSERIEEVTCEACRRNAPEVKP